MDAESTARLMSPIMRSLISVALIGFVLMLLHLAAPILTPILFAFFLVAMAISPFRWLLARGVGYGPALLLMIAILVIGGIGLFLLTLVSVRNLQAGLTLYGEQLAARMADLKTAMTHLGLEVGGANEGIAAFGVSGMSAFLAALVDVASNALISLVIVVFFLFEFERFMTIIRSERVRSVPLVGQMPEVARTAIRYFGIRTRLNFITGIGVTLICLLLGVDYALLWGVTAFFLSYIPYIGLLTAMIPPALLALAESGCRLRKHLNPDALIPLVFMIVMLTWSIVLFGIDAAAGPLQVALLMSAVVAAVVAHKNGHPWERLGEEIVKGISLAMSAILILLMVGALIGVWNMSGTIATVVYYGIKYINPAWFYFAAALLTGSSASSPAVRGRRRPRWAWRSSASPTSSARRRRSPPGRSSRGLLRRQDDAPVRDDHPDAADRGQQRLRPHPQHGQGQHPVLPGRPGSSS
jgi:predicted PurR-regulated permease PerM